jgi:hypothetical protein
VLQPQIESYTYSLLLLVLGSLVLTVLLLALALLQEGLWDEDVLLRRDAIDGDRSANWSH